MEKLVQGTKLGRFTLEKRLAVGGMAEIWLAHETVAGAEKDLALKILLASFARDPGARAMFFDEVNIASRLAHENIVQVFEAFEVEGHLIQAMELVDGRDLRRVLSAVARAGERMPIPLALRIGREIARALDYAHTKTSDDGKPLAIVHRDISPHNVMITRDGGVKVLDFGIARAAERITRTRTGVIKGKLAYMAPEQALAVSVSQRSDIFSTGILLWEMLAMQRLFKADSDAEVMERVMQADVPPVRAYNPDVPEEVAVLLHQMLAKRESMRPESMRVVEAKLGHILETRYVAEEASRQKLASWVEDFLFERGTKELKGVLPEVLFRRPTPEAPRAEEPLPEPKVITPPEPAVAPSAPAIALDRTLTMSPEDLLGASGAHPLPSLPGSESSTEPPGVLRPVIVTGEVPLVDVATTTGEHVPIDRAATTTDKTQAVNAMRGGDMTIRDLGRADELFENASADPTAKVDQPTPEELGLVTAPVRTRDLPRDAVQTVAVSVPSGMIAPPPPALAATATMLGVAGVNTPSGADTPTPDASPDEPAQRLRRPTKSQIFRAIDAVKTEPVSIDQAATIAPPKPQAKIFDDALRAKMAEVSAPRGSHDPANTPITKIPGSTTETAGEPTLSGDLTSAAVLAARDGDPSTTPGGVANSWIEVTSEEVESATFAPVPISFVEERSSAAKAAVLVRPGDKTDAPGLGPRLTAPARPEPKRMADRLGPRWTAAFVLAMLTVIILSLVLIFLKR